MSVNSHLDSMASKLVLSAAERASINNSIIVLNNRLKDYFRTEVTEQIQFGSSTRGTMLPKRADNNSDVDYMVVFSNSNDYKPNTFIEKLGRFAEAKYVTSERYRSHPTVVLNLNHLMFELVPAYKSWGTYYIPAPSSSWSTWLSTDPNGFNAELTDKNNYNAFKIKPLVRILKYWNALNGYIFESYELEKDIINRWYFGCNTVRDYLFQFIRNTTDWSLPQYKQDKIERAKKIIAKVEEYESQNLLFFAEAEIKKLIPDY